MVGTKIDQKYQLLKELGRGAMGVVYLAEHDTTGRQVALKVLHPDKAALSGSAIEAAIERFRREARAMGAVADSPNVVQVLDAGVDGASRSPYLVMELLKGEDLEALAGRLGLLPVDLCLRLTAQALAGLMPAHEAGIVHRDLKPSNLFLLQRTGGEHIVKVLDFGIAKLREGTQGAPALTAEGIVVGSPSYMSPEQVQASKTLDARSDVWSIGVLLYQLLSGQLPFGEAETLRDLLMAIVLSRPRPVATRAPWVPPEVQAIVDKATQGDAALRFAHAGEMREAILKLLPGGTGITTAMLVPLGRGGQPSTALATQVGASSAVLPNHPNAPQPSVAATGAPQPATAMGAPQPPPTAAVQPGATAQVTGPHHGVGSAAGVPSSVLASAASVPASAAPLTVPMGVPQVAASPPFAFPTQPSAGVFSPTPKKKPFVWMAVGALFLLAVVLGAVKVVSGSKERSSGVEIPLPPDGGGPTLADAGASAGPDAGPNAPPASPFSTAGTDASDAGDGTDAEPGTAPVLSASSTAEQPGGSASPKPTTSATVKSGSKVKGID